MLNAANEIAVAAFLNRRIRFDHIHVLNMATMQSVLPSSIRGLEDLLDLDRHARLTAEQIMLTLS